MLYETGDHRVLGGVRLITYGVWLVLFFIRPIESVVNLPFEMFVPQGVFRILPFDALSFLLGPDWLTFFSYAFVIVLGGALLGLPPFGVWGSMAGVAILFYDGVVKGFGDYVNHGVALWLVVALILPFSPAADSFKIGTAQYPLKRAEVYSNPLLLITVLVLFCYTFIGVHRFIYGGFEVFNGEALRSWLLFRSQASAPTSFQFGLWVANSPVNFSLYHVGFVLVSLAESLSLYCLFSRRFARGWLIFMSLFHFLSLFTLNIFFWENLLLLWLLFAPNHFRVLWFSRSAKDV